MGKLPTNSQCSRSLTAWYNIEVHWTAAQLEMMFTYVYGFHVCASIMLEGMLLAYTARPCMVKGPTRQRAGWILHERAISVKYYNHSVVHIYPNYRFARSVIVLLYESDVVVIVVVVNPVREFTRF
uniref:Uncharacterized protein n=1 Tax=Cacopsylla melanoneura TaxID=428564 RepID=A0A8D8TFG6_9HEMI